MPGNLLPSIVDGLLLGFVYGVVALGLSLIWGVMHVINLSHGAITALGMFVSYFLFTALGVNPYLGVLAAGALGFTMGYVMYHIAVRRVISGPYLSSLLSTFSVNMILIGVGTAVLTTSPHTINYSLGSLTVGSLTAQGTRLMAAAAAIVIAGALQLFLYRTRRGKEIRAVANNRAAAELMGIPTTSVLAFSFGLGTLMAAASGALISTFFPFTILTGELYQSKAFVICVLGGLGNPVGALVGGLVLGLLEGIIPAFMPVSWVPVLEFGLFVLVLVFRPTGLLGAK
ncbi:MAG: branched-chain amino acid ABC transporter permease [Anaerolineae bacterium]